MASVSRKVKSQATGSSPRFAASEERPRIAGCRLLDNVKSVPSIGEVLAWRGDERYCPFCTDTFHVLAIIRLVYQGHGMDVDQDSERSLEAEIGRLHVLSERDLLMDYIKYKCAASFSFVMKEEMPDFPSKLDGLATVGAHWAGGRFYAFTQMMRTTSFERSYTVVHPFTGTKYYKESFAQSLLMLKKGMPRPTPDRCAVACGDAYVTMTTPIQRSFSDLLVIERVKRRAQAVVKRLFGGVEFCDYVAFEWPSVSSHCYLADEGKRVLTSLASRKHDGAFGFLRERNFLPTFDRRRDFIDCDEEISQEDERTSIRLSPAAAGELVRRQAELVGEALQEFPECKPQALPEAAKVRTITAGPVLLYQALRPIQKLLHQTCARDARFAIGEPLAGRQIMRLLGLLPTGSKWVSGDYKAATDNLSIELSNAICEAIAAEVKMPAPYAELLRRSLTEHWYVEPQEGFARPQARGQLMGSVTSFPILCIANFALIWESVFPNRRFQDVSVIVNGDDCLFPATSDEYEMWKTNAASVGLSPSVGKTYFSSDFMVINSELYLDRFEGLPTEQAEYIYVPYINSGLLVGMKRSGDRETSCQMLDARSQTIGARCSALVRGWPYESAARTWLIQQFLTCNRDLIPDLRDVPLYLPECWGGYGLPESSVMKADDLELKKWVTVYELDRRNRVHYALTGDSNVKSPILTLKYSSESKRSPFYKEAVAELGRLHGWRLATGKFTVGDYQWLMSHHDIPEETDDNLVDFVDSWRYRTLVPSPHSRGAAIEYVLHNAPVTRQPAIRIAGACHPDTRVYGWSSLAPTEQKVYRAFDHNAVDFIAIGQTYAGAATLCTGGVPDYTRPLSDAERERLEAEPCVWRRLSTDVAPPWMRGISF